MISLSKNDENMICFSDLLDELAMIYVLKTETIKQMGG